MIRYLPYLLAALLAAFLILAPASYAVYTGAQMRNFRTVKEGQLYRSGQMSLAGLKRAIHDYGIKTVISLRDSNTPGANAPDLKEEEFCKAQEINYIRIAPRNWWAPDGSVPAMKGVRRFLEVMDKKENFPVLVHCFAGIHRTGAYCAVYRMEYDRWTNAEAIAEVKACGYGNLDQEWDILGFLEQYRPRWTEGEARADVPVVRRSYFRAASPRKRATRNAPPIDAPSPTY